MRRPMIGICLFLVACASTTPPPEASRVSLLYVQTASSGSFEPLRFLPKDKTVVLGLVTTKSAQLESADDLKRRIDEAARYCRQRTASWTASLAVGRWEGYTPGGRVFG